VVAVLDAGLVPTTTLVCPIDTRMETARQALLALAQDAKDDISAPLARDLGLAASAAS